MIQLEYKFKISRDKASVWQQLTTTQGIMSFFSPHVNVDFKVNGKFEIYFDLKQPEGSRGSEGMRILSIDEGFMFSFTWNNPPILKDIRNQQSVVQIYLKQVNAHETEVHFIHSGFSTSESWQESYKYFERAWGSIVLPRLKYVLEVHPFDWDDIPALSPIPTWDNTSPAEKTFIQ